MRKIALAFAFMAMSMMVSAQSNKIGISFDFSHCEYETGGGDMIEAKFYEAMPEGFAKFWENRKKELCSVFIQAANQGAKQKFLIGAEYADSPYYLVAVATELDRDGELNCDVRLYKRQPADVGYNPIVKTFEVDGNGAKSHSYDNITSKGFSKAGYELGKMLRKSGQLLQ